tara:strand:- start:1202 stop:1621 length:420 start_codon:yes stop_codon:yes gene_type:complete
MTSLKTQEMEKTYLTLKEANALIPKIRPMLLEVMHINRSLDIISSIDFCHEDDFEFARFNIETSEKFHKLSLRFYQILNQLLKQGCIVKDVGLGLVDFFSVHKNKEILLCYQVTEDSIEYWHGLDCDLHSRKHISSLNK